MRILAGIIACILFCLSGSISNAQNPVLTPKALRTAMNAGGDDTLAETVRIWFGRENLLRGPNPKVDGLMIAWAIEVSDSSGNPQITIETGFSTLDGILPADSKKKTNKLNLKRIGDTEVYALVLNFPEGENVRWSYEVGGKTVKGDTEVYSVHPDMVEKPNVPKGKVTQMPRWKSKIFEGTERDWWIYVPAQYKPEEPACVMVFQDGGGAKNYTPTCFDNLIAKGNMPVTIGMFINPGDFGGGRSNRSFEYDTLSDQYARFLMEEILPEVEKTYKLRHDPDSRAISGLSSGGICAFTVAWERPEEFRKVLSGVGSFTNIASGQSRRAGGHNYPALIRKTPKKPIRVFLQDGINDLNNEHGSWPLANLQMALSLEFTKYDYKLAFGKGAHNDRQLRAILPDALRWLWRK